MQDIQEIAVCMHVEPTCVILHAVAANAWPFLMPLMLSLAVLNAQTVLFMHTQAVPARQPAPARSAPDWVHAANLANALASTTALPHLQAAAQRDRRLAASQAFARQHLAAGHDLDTLCEQMLHGRPGGAQAQQAALLQALVEQVAGHNEQLAKALQQNNEQLVKQQVRMPTCCLY